MPIKIRRMTAIRNRSPVRAVAEVEYAGLLLRGLKLEGSGGELQLRTPGRKVGGAWQLVYELLSEELTDRLSASLVAEYRRRFPEAA